MVEKPKDSCKEMPGLIKPEARKKFAERERLERLASAYDVKLASSNNKNDAFIVVLKNGMPIGRYCVEEGETGIIDGILVITNMGGTTVGGIGLGNPQLHIGYAVPVD